MELQTGDAKSWEDFQQNAARVFVWEILGSEGKRLVFSVRLHVILSFVIQLILVVQKKKNLKWDEKSLNYLRAVFDGDGKF